MKARRHHNNKGYRQIKRGKTRDQVERIARRLKIPYVTRKEKEDKEIEIPEEIDINEWLKGCR